MCLAFALEGMKVGLRTVFSRNCYVMNSKGTLLKLFTLIAIIGVELVILASFYIPKRDVANENFYLQYDQFVHEKGTTDDDKSSNEGGANLASRSQLNYGGKSSDFKDNFVRKSIRVEDSTALPKIRSSCSQFNFSFASPVLEPTFSDRENNLFLLILIISGAGKTSFLDQRNAIRRTWAMNTPNNSWKKWKHVFLLGRSNNAAIESEIRREALLHNDILVFNSTDNYQNLIIKVFSGFRWAFMRAKPRFILKADDDVYIRVPLLVSWLNESGSDMFYGGYAYGGGAPVRRNNGLANIVTPDCYPEERFPPYNAGPFYVISSNTIPSLLESMRTWRVFPVEDAYMGLLAKTSNITPVRIPGFVLDDNITYHENCIWSSSVAFGHHFDSLHLHYLQSKMRETEELQLSRIYVLCVLHQTVVFIGMVLLHLALMISVVVAVVYAMVVLQPYFRKV